MGQIEQSKIEILEVERAFAQLVQEQGQKAGFLAFAAEDAVLHRDGKLVRGKEEIAAYFDRQTVQNVRLAWTANFVSVAASCDLGYSYGPFVFEGENENGQPLKFEGIFHTVWQKNQAGEWRYVWD